eukprot:COSAG05_NODE_4672_length_1415_cov_2.345745_3_plen_107_part_01
MVVVSCQGTPRGIPGWPRTVRPAAVTAGHTVSVASQFCFDATTLISWLELTREAVSEAVTAAAAAQQQGEGSDPRDEQYTSNRVTYHVGIPGPTKLSKLQRIAEICE